MLTHLDDAGVAALLGSYGLSLIDFAPTARGIENTNYFVTARASAGQTRRLVLTIIEDGRAPSSFLPSLLEQLTRAGLPVPALLRTGSGYAYASHPPLQNTVTAAAPRPVLLCQRLAGVHRHAATPADCATIGRFLARLHRAASPLCGVAPEHPRQGTWLLARCIALHTELAAWQASLLDEAVAYALKLLQRGDYAALPDAVVHGDLFRDNALFTADGLSGVIDFHHAARHKRLFDVAVAVNDWCTTLEHRVDDVRAFALLSGYQAITPLTLSERLLLPGMLAYAALTFALSRLHVAAADANPSTITLPSKSALPMLLKLNHHLREPWLGRAA